MDTDEDILRSYGDFIHEDRGIQYCYLKDNQRSITMSVGESKEEAVTKLLGKVKSKVMHHCEWLESIRAGCV